MAEPLKLRRWRALLRRGIDKWLRGADLVVARLFRVRQRHSVAIIMPHGLGDLILFTAAYHHLRAYYRERPVILVCAPGTELYAETYLRPARVMVLDRLRFRRHPAYRMGLVYSLARAGSTAVLQPARNRELMVEDALVRASGAAERVGAAASALLITAAQRALSDGWYTRLVADDPAAVHDSAHYAAFARAVTGSFPAQWLQALDRPPRPGQAPAGAYLVVAGEASSALKTWPLARFLAAAASLSAATGWSVVLAGRQAAGNAPAGTAVIDLRGWLDMQGLTALLAHARIVLCNDSGPAHLAAALGVPAVAVGGGGIVERYLPYPAAGPGIAAPVQCAPNPPWPCFGCGWQCIYRPPPGAAAPCMADTGVETVVQAGLAALASLQKAN